MIKKNEPYLLEFNVRMGDPECQVILPRLKTDIVKIFYHAVQNKLSRIKIEWRKEKSMTIVLCSKGYPLAYKKNKKIMNLSKIKVNKKIFIYHAGTKYKNKDLLSNGGRVLNISAIGSKFINIRSDIIKVLKKINWKAGFFRKDIGWRVIK
jgi:phosphoribosylamine--glycine ligase